MKITNTINKLIKKNNALMSKSTKAEKRVLIAKDVLKQIKIHKFDPQSGAWFDSSVLELHNLYDDDSAQPALLMEQPTCNVCALGGLFLSTIRLNNKCPVRELLESECDLGGRISEGDSTLNKIFSIKQLQLIEATFEVNGGAYRASQSKYDRVGDFYTKYPDVKDRLVAIMKNIIKNKGTFILPK